MVEAVRKASVGPTTLEGQEGVTSDMTKVFITYSHDSAAHKEWVRSVAEQLMADGIEVTYDQKDLRLGMLPASFMEESLRAAHRTILIITEPYTTKANNLSSGVGYERMIITAEVAKNLKTTKFLPVLRSGGELPAFLGDRIYLDARTQDAWDAGYPELLADILQNPGGPAGSAAERGVVVDLAGRVEPAPATEAFHWSHHVHSHVGNTLNLILLRFRENSIQPRESVIKNLAAAGISDYSTFHLYAGYDLLIRAWANKESIEHLRKRLAENGDLNQDEIEVIEANGVRYIPDDRPPYSEDELAEASRDLTAEQIDAVQKDRAGVAPHTRELQAAGLRLQNRVRFDELRIQFYIVVRQLRHNERPLKDLPEKIARMTKVKNKTVYFTSGTAIEAVIKGQVAQTEYYEIREFLAFITDELRNVGVSTQTLLVASGGHNGDGLIDIHDADKHLVDKEFRSKVVAGVRLDAQTELALMSRFAEARSAMQEDRRQLLVGLLRARADSNNLEVFGHIRTFFADLEGSLVANQSRVMGKLFGKETGRKRKEILAAEGLEEANSSRLVLGDSLKVYRRLIEDHGIIPLHPLSEDAFRRVMQKAPEIRNPLAHAPTNLEAWEETFLFFMSFVRIENRLQKFFAELS